MTMPAQRFFHSLQLELIHRYSFETRGGMRQAVFQHIEVNYNRKSPHSVCDYLSREAYEKRWAT